MKAAFEARLHRWGVIAFLLPQGSVDQVYEEPSSLRAMQLLGFPGANSMPGVLEAGICRSAFGDFSVEFVASGGPAPTREVTMVFRPEAILFGSAKRTPGLLKSDLFPFPVRLEKPEAVPSQRSIPLVVGIRPEHARVSSTPIPDGVPGRVVRKFRGVAGQYLVA